MCEKVVFDYSKLKGRIVEKFGTQGRFAAANQLTDRSMSLKLNNGIGLSQEEVLKWLNNGAQPSDTVKNLLSKEGIIKKFADSKSGK